MSARVLPREEWERLEGVGPAPLLAHADKASVVVVEDAGRIVAAMGVIPFVHLEGAWIDPAHRNAGVTRALLRAAFDVAGPWVVAGSTDSQMADILTRLGGERLPVDFYVLARKES